MFDEVGNGTTVKQFHIITDARTGDHGAVAYARGEVKNGNICGQLILSKTRVSPLRHIALPRLKLLGALMSSRIAKSFTALLGKNNWDSYLWEHSTVALI